MGGETMNFINGAELLEYCEKENKKISEAMFERETTFLEQDPEKTRAKMKKAWSIMQASAKKPLKENIVSMGGMIGGESRKLHTLRENKKNLCGDVVSKAIAYAVGVLEVVHGTHRCGTDGWLFWCNSGSLLFPAGKLRIYG